MNNMNVGIINLMMSEKLKNRYFGTINESIDDSEVSIDKFLELIKESSILKTEFKVINNIENKHIDNESAATRYIDNNIKLFEIYTLDEVIEEKNKLKEFYNKSYENVQDEEKIKLYESINNLIIQSLNDHEEVNVDIMHESFNYVLNHVKTPKKDRKPINKEVIDFENINESIIRIAVDKFNEKYKSLSEKDKNFLYNLIESNEMKKKELFEELKNENINILNETNDTYLIDRKHKALNKIKLMNYNKDTIDDDLTKLYELKTGLI